jgi:hypothetical protein
MSQVVEISEEGAIYLPPEMLKQLQPHTRFTVELQNGTLILRPEDKTQPFWATATPEEWVKDFREWVASHKTGPNLPQEALSRDSMYD